VGTDRTIFTLHRVPRGRYGRGMEVPVSALRAELKSWIERARSGEEIVVTERGVPVARLTGVATADLVTELTRDGVLSPPSAERPAHAVAAPDDVPSARPVGVPAAAARSTRPTGVAALVRRIRR
jgi:prevent-host-death family protein